MRRKAEEKTGKSGKEGELPDDVTAQSSEPRDDCCQVCPSVFYHDLSFLQLPEHVEAVAVERFKEWHAAVEPRAARERVASRGAAHSPRRSSRGLLSLHTRARERGGGASMLTTVRGIP